MSNKTNLTRDEFIVFLKQCVKQRLNTSRMTAAFVSRYGGKERDVRQRYLDEIKTYRSYIQKYEENIKVESDVTKKRSHENVVARLSKSLGEIELPEGSKPKANKVEDLLSVLGEIE